MSFRLYTGEAITEEVLSMLDQLSNTPNSYAISDLSKEVIKRIAKLHGYKVSTKTVGYHEIKVKLVEVSTEVNSTASSEQQSAQATSREQPNI